MNIKKVLVTGSTGMLGTSMISALAAKGYEVIPSNFVFTHMDIRNESEVIETAVITNPDIILHLAAETDVDKCEREKEHAYRVNVVGTLNIATVCKELNIPMLYVSTIGVFFGNKKEPYNESDFPKPTNYYGHTKLLGEKVVSRILNDYYIVRAGWMIGGGPTKDKKFVGKIIRQLETSPKEIKAVTDKVGSPTYAPDFSEVVANLIGTGKYGLYHCTNHGYPSRYDVACEIVKLLGSSTKVIPVDSSEFSYLSAGRANSEMSDNVQLNRIGLDSMRDWKEALKDYIYNYWLPPCWI